jgi:hypothetical protein
LKKNVTNLSVSQPIPHKKHSLVWCARIWLTAFLASKFSSYQRDRLEAFGDQLEGELPQSEGTGDIILAACNDGYFNTFVPALLSSLNRLPTRHALHLHLLEPSAETLLRIVEYQQQFQGIRLTYTIDMCLAARNLYYRNIYYNAARFVLAPLLFRWGMKRILIIDVDAIVRKSPWKMLDEMEGAAFIFRPAERSPWRKILASTILYQSDVISRQLADRFARAILGTLPQRPRYHIDQILAHYLIEIGASSVRSRISQIPEHLMSLEYEEEAAIWMAKGEGKHAERFNLEMQKFSV